MEPEKESDVVEQDGQEFDIFVFSNGQQYSPPRKHHLHSRDLSTWHSTLALLARAQYGAENKGIELYTTDGRKVEDPAEIQNFGAYVAVVPPDAFIDTGYDKYLIKASKSWERRQSKRNSALDQVHPDENNTKRTSIDNRKDAVDVQTVDQNLALESVVSQKLDSEKRIQKSNPIRRNSLKEDEKQRDRRSSLKQDIANPDEKMKRGTNQVSQPSNFQRKIATNLIQLEPVLPPIMEQRDTPKGSVLLPNHRFFLRSIVKAKNNSNIVKSKNNANIAKSNNISSKRSNKSWKVPNKEDDRNTPHTGLPRSSKVLKKPNDDKSSLTYPKNEMPLPSQHNTTLVFNSIIDQQDIKPSQGGSLVKSDDMKADAEITTLQNPSTSDFFIPKDAVVYKLDKGNMTEYTQIDDVITNNDLIVLTTMRPQQTDEIPPISEDNSNMDYSSRNYYASGEYSDADKMYVSSTLKDNIRSRNKTKHKHHQQKMESIPEKMYVLVHEQKIDISDSSDIVVSNAPQYGGSDTKASVETHSLLFTKIQRASETPTLPEIILIPENEQGKNQQSITLWIKSPSEKNYDTESTPIIILDHVQEKTITPSSNTADYPIQSKDQASNDGTEDLTLLYRKYTALAEPGKFTIEKDPNQKNRTENEQQKSLDTQRTTEKTTDIIPTLPKNQQSPYRRDPLQKHRRVSLQAKIRPENHQNKQSNQTISNNRQQSQQSTQRMSTNRQQPKNSEQIVPKTQPTKVKNKPSSSNKQLSQQNQLNIPENRRQSDSIRRSWEHSKTSKLILPDNKKQSGLIHTSFRSENNQKSKLTKKTTPPNTLKKSELISIANNEQSIENEIKHSQDTQPIPPEKGQIPLKNSENRQYSGPIYKRISSDTRQQSEPNNIPTSFDSHQQAQLNNEPITSNDHKSIQQSRKLSASDKLLKSQPIDKQTPLNNRQQSQEILSENIQKPQEILLESPQQSGLHNQKYSQLNEEKNESNNFQTSQPINPPDNIQQSSVTPCDTCQQFELISSKIDQQSERISDEKERQSIQEKSPEFHEILPDNNLINGDELPTDNLSNSERQRAIPTDNIQPPQHDHNTFVDNQPKIETSYQQHEHSPINSPQTKLSHQISSDTRPQLKLNNESCHDLFSNNLYEFETNHKKSESKIENKISTTNSRKSHHSYEIPHSNKHQSKENDKTSAANLQQSQLSHEIHQPDNQQVVESINKQSSLKHEDSLANSQQSNHKPEILRDISKQSKLSRETLPDIRELPKLSVGAIPHTYEQSKLNNESNQENSLDKLHKPKTNHPESKLEHTISPDISLKAKHNNDIPLNNQQQSEGSPKPPLIYDQQPKEVSHEILPKILQKPELSHENHQHSELVIQKPQNDLNHSATLDSPQITKLSTKNASFDNPHSDPSIKILSDKQLQSEFLDIPISALIPNVVPNPMQTTNTSLDQISGIVEKAMLEKHISSDFETPSKFSEQIFEIMQVKKPPPETVQVNEPDKKIELKKKSQTLSEKHQEHNDDDKKTLKDSLPKNKDLNSQHQSHQELKGQETKKSEVSTSDEETTKTINNNEIHATLEDKKDPTENHVVILVKEGDIIYVKVDIALRNANTTLTCNNLHKSKSDTDVKKYRNKNNNNGNNEMLTHSQSLQSIENELPPHACCRKDPRVVIVQCGCCHFCLHDGAKFSCKMDSRSFHPDNNQRCFFVMPTITQRNGENQVEKGSQYSQHTSEKQIQNTESLSKINIVGSIKDASVGMSPFGDRQYFEVSSLCQMCLGNDKCEYSSKCLTNLDNDNLHAELVILRGDPSLGEAHCELAERRISFKQQTDAANSDKYTQTNWCDVLLEIRPHPDGHYTFHLPPLHVLRNYGVI